MLVGDGTEAVDNNGASSSGVVVPTTAQSEDAENQMLEDINLVLNRFPDADPNEIYERLHQQGSDDDERVEVIISRLEREARGGAAAGTSTDLKGILQQGLNSWTRVCIVDKDMILTFF